MGHVCYKDSQKGSEFGVDRYIVRYYEDWSELIAFSFDIHYVQMCADLWMNLTGTTC